MQEWSWQLGKTQQLHWNCPLKILILKFVLFLYTQFCCFPLLCATFAQSAVEGHCKARTCMLAMSPSPLCLPKFFILSSWWISRGSSSENEALLNPGYHLYLPVQKCWFELLLHMLRSNRTALNHSVLSLFCFLDKHVHR